MEQSPRKRHRKWPWIVLSFIAVYALWWVLTPISWTSTKAEQYPNGVEVRIISLHELCAYVGMEGVVIPVPYYHVDDRHECIVLADGKEWIRTQGVSAAITHPSPGRTYIVLEDLVQNKPIRILDLATRGTIELAVDDSKDEFPGHYNGFPFHFLRWEDDKSFLVEVEGSPGENVKYPQTWRVEAKTGKRTPVE